MGLSRIFDISRRSMAVYQNALDATAHNISNSSNPDYSRQQVKLSTEKAEFSGGFLWGTGVKYDSVERVRNSLTDAQIRTNNQKNSESSRRNELLGQVEQLFSEPSDSGLSSLMNGFFNSWQELSVTPNSMPLRYNVLRAAEKISDKTQSIYENLDLIKTDIMNEMKTKVDTLNNYLEQVQSLNAQIFSFKTSGGNANDLMDQRDQVIDQLSKMANITVSTDSNNSVTVSVGGVFAVDQANVTKFKISEDPGGLSLVSEKGETTALLTGGDLYALSDVYSHEIPGYQASIDKLCSTFVDQVNNVHKKGYSLENPPGTGIDFFEGYSAGVIKINSQISGNPLKIAASGDGTSGNSTIAVQIAELSGKALISGSTLNDFYSSLISEIGSKKSLAEQSTDSTDLVLQQLQTQKQSYSGVSVDEEMTNIIKYQKAYEASAKMIKVADDLLQTILNMV